MKNFGFGFKAAFRGIVHSVLCERNFRVHIAAMFTVIYFASVYGIDWLRASVLALTIACVLAAELMNTAVEAIVDKISPEKCNLAKIAKDCSAAAVLIMAIAAVFVAVAVFSDAEGWQRVFVYIKEQYLKLILFAVLVTGFIFIKNKEYKG